MNISEFKNIIWDYTRKINENTNKAFNPICEQYGLTMLQVRILMELNHYGSHTIGSLANRIDVAGANISAMCKKLEHNGFLERTRDKNDERVVMVILTEKGNEIVFNTVTSGASNDIEQATKIARAMVTRFGMSEKFGMMALETVNNQYLGGDTSLLVSADTAAKIDEEVLGIIESAHGRATQILEENKEKLHELTKYLLEKETISGEEFMTILSK